MADDNQDDQNSVKDDQDYEINIDKIYTDYIQEIDAVRSYVNVSDPNNINFFKNLTVDSVTSIVKKLKVEDTPQESRCHAFFRLIGFPVIRNGGENFYSPGLDNIKDTNTDTNKKSKFQSKLDIANDQIKGFYNLSNTREYYFSYLKTIFSKTGTIESSILALSSGSVVRNFSDALDKFGNEPSELGTAVDDDFNSKSFNALDINVKNQSYDLKFKVSVGSNSFELYEFVNAAGLPISYKDYITIFLGKQHIVAPYIVDPKIDFSISPAKNKIAVPFTISKQNLKISEINFVRRPLIEKIIKERLFIELGVNAAGGSNLNSVVDYIKNVPSIKNDLLVKQISQRDIYGLNEQLQFIKYVNIIRTMCFELVKSQKIIKSAQSKYYWLPISNGNGPEFPNGSQKVFSFPGDSDEVSVSRNKFIANMDRAIIQQQKIVTMNELNAQTRELNGKADIGGYAFDGIDTSFDVTHSAAYGSIATDSLKDLAGDRDVVLQRASTALRTVEIIMGEFSGLGLCDIVAILGALYTISKSSLIGLIDDYAYERMKLDINLDTKIPRNSVSVSLYDLSTKTKEFYDIMDKIYLDTNSKNLRI